MWRNRRRTRQTRSGADDPFDQINPNIPDVELIDANAGGPDNRGSDPAVGSYSAITGDDGKATVTITVSMQPGNNYRAAASTFQERLNRISQPTADGINAHGGDWSDCSEGVLWSQMLTVWRKLHVETDAMARPTFAENTVFAEWDDPRFQGGQLWIDIRQQPGYDDLENGYIRIQAAEFSDLISIIIEHNPGPWQDNVVRTNISQATWGGRPGWGDFIASDDDLANEANFLAGIVGSDIGIGNPPKGRLPLPDTSRLAHHYQPAYILPVVETEHTSLTGIAFRKNINNVEYEPAWIPILPSRTLAVSTPDYWTAYVYSAFQAEGWQDYDGEVYATKGINTHLEGWTHARWEPEYTGMSAIFAEAIDDAFGEAELRIAVAHEIAHTLGLPHALGLMGGETQTDAFGASSLRKLREYNGP